MSIIEERKSAGEATAERASGPPRGRPPILAIGLAAVAVVVIAVVAIVLASSSSSNQSAAYRQKLRSALAPLVSANRALSSSLELLPRGETALAVSAAARNEQVLLTARGAVAAMAVPKSSAPLARDVQRAFASENAYLQWVSTVLASPSSISVAAAQALASATTRAFAPLSAVSPGLRASIFGTASLVRWAQSQPAKPRSAAASSSNPVGAGKGVQAAAALGPHGNAIGRLGAAASPVGKATAGEFVTPSGGAVPGYWTLTWAPYATGVGTPFGWSGGTQCDQNIFAGDGTSCGYADNIFEVVAAADHYYDVIPASIGTYDPTTGIWYVLACTEYWGNDNQSDLQCIDDNGNGAAFPVGAANVYYGS